MREIIDKGKQECYIIVYVEEKVTKVQISKQ